MKDHEENTDNRCELLGPKRRQPGVTSAAAAPSDGGRRRQEGPVVRMFWVSTKDNYWFAAENLKPAEN
jgi:hypothetical protein